MTKREILEILVLQAKANGFGFRNWFEATIDPTWTGFEDALELLSEGRRYYALLFAHEFARFFWKQGSQISFVVPESSYTRRDKDGRMVTITRKAFTRRTLKTNSWKYHIREMAAHEDPLRYIRRFLKLQEDVEPTQKSSL